MIDAISPTMLDQIHKANRELDELPFYIGTSRRQVGGIDFVVHLNLEGAVIGGFIAAQVSGPPPHPEQAHPLALLGVSLRGGDREQILAAGKLDAAGKFPLAGIPTQIRYFLHLGEV